MFLLLLFAVKLVSFHLFDREHLLFVRQCSRHRGGRQRCLRQNALKFTMSETCFLGLSSSSLGSQWSMHFGRHTCPLPFSMVISLTTAIMNSLNIQSRTILKPGLIALISDTTLPPFRLAPAHFEDIYLPQSPRILTQTTTYWKCSYEHASYLVYSLSVHRAGPVLCFLCISTLPGHSAGF